MFLSLSPGAPADTVIETERLYLRAWRESDREAYAAINAHPLAMEFFPELLSRQESDRQIDLMNECMRQVGYSFWAAELKTTQALVGFVGIHLPLYPLPVSPVEVGWRLHPNYWGQGLAQEAAKASLEYGFERYQLKEIIAVTATLNWRSQKLMNRLGMIQDPSCHFLHPKVPKEHPLAPHVLYRLKNQRRFIP